MPSPFFQSAAAEWVGSYVLSNTKKEPVHDYTLISKLYLPTTERFTPTEKTKAPYSKGRIYLRSFQNYLALARDPCSVVKAKVLTYKPNLGC